MSKIYDNILETIGNTPLIRLNRLDKDLPGNVVIKAEFFNPANSVKDRIGKAIIDAAEAAGELKPGGTIVEATSGNTGIALALAGAARGYNVVLTMPDAPSWSSCACDTPPTICRRPVGDVVVAQALTRVVMTRASSSCFMEAPPRSYAQCVA